MKHVFSFALVTALSMACPALAAQENDEHPERKFQRYSDVKKWTGQIVYRRTSISNYQLGDGHFTGRTVWAGDINMSAQDLSTDGFTAHWVGSDKCVEHASDELYSRMDAPKGGVTTEEFHNWAGTFTDVGGAVDMDYAEGTYRVEGSGGEWIDVKKTLVFKGPTGTISQEEKDTFGPHSGRAPVEDIPLPVPKDGQGLGLIGGKTWTEKKQIPAGTPEGNAAIINGTDVTYELFWTVVPDVEEVELVVDIDGYEGWIPKGNKIESQAGSQLNVTASLQARGGGASTKKAQWIKFELLGTSREPGVCLNWPQKPKPASFDLKFAEKQGSLMAFDEGDALRMGEFQVAQTVGGPHTQAKALIECYDYGAWSTLRVTAQLDDTRIIVGHLRANPQNVHITLPWRQNGSLIAQAWKDGRRGADVADSADVEKTQDNAWDGDGFSLYEEYRGLFINGSHGRLDPSRKELCLLDKVKGPTVRAFRTFERASQIRVKHEFRPGEFRDDRVMNFNRTDRSPRSSREFQHGIIVLKGKSDIASYTYPTAGWKGELVPKHVDRIELAPSLLASVEGNAPGISWRTVFGVEVLSDSFDDLAHEMGHACGAKEHGPYTDPADVKWFLDKSVTPHRMMEQVVGTHWGPIQNPAPPKQVHVYWEDGRRASANPAYSEIDLQLYLANYMDCEHSGDANCLMRYDLCDAYVHPKRPADGRIWLTDCEPRGRTFCRSQAGTLVNESGRTPWPRHGDCVGERGNCLAILCVNDSLRP